VRPDHPAAEPDEKRTAMLHEMFEQQAALTPAVAALAHDGGADISYAELDGRANALALRLRESGVTPRTNVALLARTGPNHVIGMLAALKCGAAFTTLDADDPAARQQHIVDKLTPSALLYDPELRDSAHRLTGQHTRVSATESGGVDHAQQRHELAGLSPADTAFIAFTSGSTGRPKGIVQSHRSFAQFLTWFGRTFDFCPGTRLAQWAAPTYDAAYCEILGALLFGATVCLVPRRARNDPAAFLRWGESSRITVLETVPSYAAQLLKQTESTNTRFWSDLRYVLLAGEELTAPLAGGLERVLPADVDIYNLYGPSECVLATYHRVAPEDLSATSIPIGRAIDGRQLVVLDETGAECGPGVVGEICVRSEFLADGYLHDPARTASVFADRSGLGNGTPSRELHTADLGRWRAPGVLEWLGRRDNMVKRRGVRIEIEEVERRLRDLPEVSECAVTAIHPDGSDSGIVLVGHIVPAGAELAGRADAPEHVRRRATSVLPTQLIPDTFVLARGLPKLPNGKLDRNALASVAIRKPEGQTSDSAALTYTEEQIARIFSAVLGVSSIGGTDDFFNLGGHSLLAMTVLDRIRVSTGVDLPMLSIFERPTVRQLAALVESHATGQSQALMESASGTPVEPASRISREYPLTPGQKAIWVADRLLPGNPAYNVPLITSIKGPVNVQILEQCLRGVIERHGILRASYRFDGLEPVHVIADIITSPLRIIDLTTHPVDTTSKAAETVVREFTDSPFDLEAGGLIRSALVTLNHDDHILALTMHHLVCDERSLYVLADDLAALYESAADAAALPQSDVQFEQFVASIGARPGAGPGAGPDAEAGTGQPHQRSASPAQLRRAASGVPAYRIRGVLSQRQTTAIRSLASRTGATLFSTLLTCFGAALRGQPSARTPLVLDVPVSGRPEAFSRCVGCFIDTAHVSVAPDRGATFRQLLKSMHSQLAAADSAATDGRAASDAAALFTVHSGATPFVQLADLSCAPYVMDRNTAKYGLGFYWRDDAVTLSYIVEYATDLYSRGEIDDLIARYDELIDQVCVDPDVPPIRSGSHL
jgi:amino acid adenylation domain-containing protein